MTITDGLLSLGRRVPWLVARLQEVGWIDRPLNRLAIDYFVEQGQARPLPYSTWSPRPIDPPLAMGPGDAPADYITWASLFDRSFTARHLPPADADYVARLPSIDDVVALYKRDAFIPSTNTSALFCFFAQWFTDSFLRTHPVDRRLNTSNHEIDVCQIYGLDAPTARILRTLKGGRLRTGVDGLFPDRLFDANGTIRADFSDLPYMAHQPDGTTLEDVVLGSLTGVSVDERARRKLRLYATGLERGNSTIFYTAISSVFIREHNRICGELAKAYPSWDDDRLFETARNTIIVMGLALVINEYINQLAQSPFKLSLDRNFAEREPWYRTNRIAIEFDLLYRWHSLVPDGIAIDGTALTVTDIQFNNALLEQYGAEALIAAASRRPAGRIGIHNNPDFLKYAESNGHIFARAQRVRPFVEYQAHFKTKPVTSFEELAGEFGLAKQLSDLYRGRIEDVELVVGLFAQHHDDDAVLPDLMRTMVAVDAFSQILTNPLLSENVYGEAAFSKVGLDIIDGTRCFEDLVRRNCAPGTQGMVEASFAYKPAPKSGA